MDFQIGDVIEHIHSKRKYVITSFKNNEDSGSCSYDRYYGVEILTDVVNAMNKNMHLQHLSNTSYHVTGIKWEESFPFKKCVDEAPFRFPKVEYNRIERAKPIYNTTYSF